MYIEPNSTLTLYKNLKLDPDYANTFWFQNLSSQTNFFTVFDAQHQINLNHLSYQRKDRGVLKVNLAIQNAYNLTYMRFKNTSFENKWFYAFITKVEYVSNEVCYIYYVLDLIQSYMFDWTLHECMIERQHSSTDVAGDNLESEGFNIGDAISDSTPYTKKFTTTTDYCALLCTGKQIDLLSQRGALSGLFSGCYISKFDNVSDLLTILNSLQEENQIGSIASITMFPKSFATINQSFPMSESFDLVTRATQLDGYSPLNNKMLTYPYCYLKVYNDQNQEMDLRYEQFNYNSGSNVCHFVIYGITSATPELVLYPNYDNSNNTPHYALSCGGFPQISYYNDGYKAWLAMNYDAVELKRYSANESFNITSAQNTYNRMVNTFQTGLGVLGGSVSAGMGFADGNIGGGISSSLGAVGTGISGLAKDQNLQYAQQQNELNNYVANQTANIQESVAKKLPNSPNGGTTSCATATDRKGFYFQRMSIRKQFAEKCDKFFTMFGYAQNKADVPNIHTRSRYTYTKTSGCNISGNIPADDKQGINAIFDRGIRFWDVVTDGYLNFESYPYRGSGGTIVLPNNIL